VFERFTERARHAVVAAQEEARALHHREIAPEHLLLGLLHDDKSMAARALASLGVTLDRARSEVLRHLPPGDEPFGPQIPFTPAAKQVLERSLIESRELGHNYLGTEHLLLALATFEEGESANVLRALGADAGAIRDTVITLLAGGGADPGPHGGRRRGFRRASVRHPGAPVPVPPLVGTFTIAPGDDLVRLLMSAAARALEDGRTEISADDVLIALARAGRTGALLAELGASEAAIRAALERRGDQEPPEAAAGR
jgi:ATP-dependent Clp protease ATP-binding subunit ClpA